MKHWIKKPLKKKVKNLLCLLCKLKWIFVVYVLVILQKYSYCPRVHFTKILCCFSSKVCSQSRGCVVGCKQLIDYSDNCITNNQLLVRSLIETGCHNKNFNLKHALKGVCSIKSINNSRILNRLRCSKQLTPYCFNSGISKMVVCLLCAF